MEDIKLLSILWKSYAHRGWLKNNGKPKITNVQPRTSCFKQIKGFDENLWRLRNENYSSQRQSYKGSMITSAKCLPINSGGQLQSSFAKGFQWYVHWLYKLFYKNEHLPPSRKARKAWQQLMMQMCLFLQAPFMFTATPQALVKSFYPLRLPLDGTPSWKRRCFQRGRFVFLPQPESGVQSQPTKILHDSFSLGNNSKFSKYGVNVRANNIQRNHETLLKSNRQDQSPFAKKNQSKGRQGRSESRPKPFWTYA